MIEKIWQILTTFTPESQKTVFAKCNEFGFDSNRGDISLEEAYINLNSCTLILKEAIEKQKLIQLPITIQNILIAHLEGISTAQTNLIAGSDQIINLKTHIENLNTSMWQYGMFNLSDEVLGYQTKLNQLKQLELEIAKLHNELKEGIKIKKKIDEANQNASQKLEEINNVSNSSSDSLEKIKTLLNNSNSENQQIAAILSSAQKNESIITKAKADATQNAAEVSSIEQKIKEFFNEINNYKIKIDASASNAETAITTNDQKTSALIKKLEELENQIKKQIEKATGFSLFHSFQTRQGLIRKSKIFWVCVLAGLLILTAILTGYLIASTADINTAFFLKLSLSVPLIFAISFATIQYSRERKLEEEYAFKSNISISLKPYQELVESLILENDPSQRKEYAAFIISAINKVFTSPTEEIFKEKRLPKGTIDTKILKEMGEIAKALKNH